MNAVSNSVNAPRVPQVNLLPPEVAARRSRGRVRALIVVLLILFFFVLVAAWYFAFTVRMAAESELTEQQERGVELNAQLAEFSDIPELEAELHNSRMARFWAGSVDVIIADVFSALVEVMPTGVRFEMVEYKLDDPYGDAGGDGTIFSTDDIGQLTFIAHSNEPVLAADLIEAIDSLPGHHRTYVTVVEIQGDGSVPYWEISGTSRVTENVLSGRVITELDPARLIPDEEEDEEGAQPVPSDDADAEPEEQS
jgi:hypothetical protein